MKYLVLGLCWKKRRLLHRHGEIELNSNDSACGAKGHKNEKASVDFLTSTLRYGSFTRSSLTAHEERFAHINESWMSEYKGQIAVLSGLTLYTHLDLTMVTFLSLPCCLPLICSSSKNSHHGQNKVPWPTIQTGCICFFSRLCGLLDYRRKRLSLCYYCNKVLAVFSN